MTYKSDYETLVAAVFDRCGADMDDYDHISVEDMKTLLDEFSNEFERVQG